MPQVFAWAKDFFAEYIDLWGYQQDRTEYTAALGKADVIVSTAKHEFFGLSVAEAIAAGAFPLLPKRLSYPELLESVETKRADEFFYDGSIEDLARRLTQAAGLVELDQLWLPDRLRGVRRMERFWWQNSAPILDDALQHLPSSF